MPSAEDIAKTVNRYLELIAEGRTDDVVELYTDDATVEDPVGGEVHIGREAIRGFYAAVLGAKAETDVVTLRALGNEAAYFWRLTIDLGDGARMRVEIISVMTFDEGAKITSLKAYWGPDNMTQL